MYTHIHSYIYIYIYIYIYTHIHTHIHRYRTWGLQFSLISEDLLLILNDSIITGPAHGKN